MRVLITGATGQVGGHIAWNLWKKGHEVWALVRPERLGQWNAFLGRLEALFGPVCNSCTRPRPITGHLWMRRAGVSSVWTTTHRGQFDAVVHSAADTRFHPVRTGDQIRTNVEGALSVADLTIALDVPHLIHLSTLFVGGRHSAPFVESDLDRGQTFRCAYERSKWEGERRLRRWAANTHTRLSVVRPGIVVGCSATGATLTFPHLYGFLRALHRYLAHRAPGDVLTVPLAADAALPLVCGDWVSEVVESLITAEGRTAASAEIETLHLFDPEGPSLCDLCTAMSGFGCEDWIQFDPTANPSEIVPPASARTLWAWIQGHLPYLSASGQFDCSQTLAWAEARDLRPPHLDWAVLNRLREFWERETHPSALRVPA